MTTYGATYYNKAMLKTYIYVPDSLNEQITRLAEFRKKSKAEVIRNALEKGLSFVQQQGTASAQVLLKIAQLGKKYKVKGPKDAVERFDEYLYGRDWSKDE